MERSLHLDMIQGLIVARISDRYTLGKHHLAMAEPLLAVHGSVQTIVI
jgi:hypothetical protein